MQLLTPESVRPAEIKLTEKSYNAQGSDYGESIYNKTRNDEGLKKIRERSKVEIPLRSFWRSSTPYLKGFFMAALITIVFPLAILWVMGLASDPNDDSDDDCIL